MGGLRDGLILKVTPIDAGSNLLDAEPGGVPPDCIGGVAVPITPEVKEIDGNLGVYDTFELAVAALHGNHRCEWSREERRRPAGAW